MLDAFMQHASDYVRIFICDSEACNLMLKALIHGTLDNSMKRKIAETRFFSRLRYSEVPGLSVLPSFPMLLCKLEGDFLYCMPGAAHAAKNSCTQLMAPTSCCTSGPTLQMPVEHCRMTCRCRHFAAVIQ